MTRTLRAALLAALTAGSLASPTPAHATDYLSLGGTAVFQTFVSEGYELESMSIWLSGGSALNDVFLYFSNVCLDTCGAPIMLDALGIIGSITPTVAGWQEYTFTPFYRRLTPGTTYAFTVTSSDRNTELNTAAVMLTDGNVYSDGAAGTFRWPTDRGGAPPPVLAAGHDIAYSLTYTATPEPLSLTLLGTGLAGVGALRRRRRQQPEQGGE